MVGEQHQGPTGGRKAKHYSDLLAIVTHPAFRLGFLDAQSGHGLDHDRIIDRIANEAPATALKRIGWRFFPGSGPDLFNEGRRVNVELAQYRYEEGRLSVVEIGLRCKAWGHPDYPPKAVSDYIWDRSRALPLQSEE